jgi:cbb3-type cytochrome oxidase subunit 3
LRRAMEILKNTSLLTALFIIFAILVVVFGVSQAHVLHAAFYIIFAILFIGVSAWREHIYRKGSAAQQARISEQQDEVTRLVHQICEMQKLQGIEHKKNFASLVEEMRGKGILSDSTANNLLKFAREEVQVSEEVIFKLSPASGSVADEK